jgi:hypothetical protein
MNRINLILGSLAVIGWVLVGLLAYRPAPEPKVETVERVKYVDKIINRDVVREVKKPDGTTIVTRTVVKEVQAQREKSETKTETSPLSRYQVGLGVQLGRELLMNQPTYSFEVGARLGDSPLWIKTQLTSSREAFVGLSFEF